MYIAQPGANLVEVFSLESIAKYGHEVVKKVLMSGGFFAAQIPVGISHNLPLEMVRVTKASQLECLKMLEGTHVIQVLKEVQDRLTQKDVDALVLHEEGHIRHGHTDPVFRQGKSLHHGYIVDMTAELQADAYSADKVGKKQTATALTHAMEVLCELSVTQLGKLPFDQLLYKEALSTTLMNPHFRTRITALQ